MTVNALNIHVGLFTNMVFVIEFTPGGGFVNSYNFRSFPSSLYNTKFVFAVCFCCFFLILLLYASYIVLICYDSDWKLFGQ